METIKTTNIYVTTRRRLVISGGESDAAQSCGDCGGPVLPAQTAADLLGISSRTIYRLVEAGAIHFIENDGSLSVCLSSADQALKQIS